MTERTRIVVGLGWLLVVLPFAAVAADGDAPDAPITCPASASEDAAVGILVAPEEPVTGTEVRIVVATLASETPLAVRVDDAGRPLAGPTIVRPGVPAATITRVVPSTAGTLRVAALRDGRAVRCVSIRVRDGGDARRAGGGAGVWKVTRDWGGAEEALYSAWIRELFHAPRGEDLAFPRLDGVTSDPSRNLLHGALGLGEDDPGSGLELRPDCADTPYVLRAYYAWKRGLPFGYRPCSRGTRGTAPSCGALRDPTTAAGATAGGSGSSELARARTFLEQTVGGGVHTGNGRAALAASASDFYPVKLDRHGLRPGVIYADPYGHILMLVELVAPENGRPGVLYAIDGQPDESITRKRFWEGNFLWNADPALGGSGFKAFRPVFRGPGGARVAPDNDALARDPDYGDASLEQGTLDADEFYDRVAALVTPGVRDPFIDQEEAITALAEAAKVRVTSVENGERWHASHRGMVIDMPSGFAIFEAAGEWEDYSTPSRDLRLLIALDVVAGFDEKVARDPRAYGVTSDAEIAGLRARLAADRERKLADPALAFTYVGSDGSSRTITLAELGDRSRALEVAYNPNDCPEIRWGAEGSELATCNRRAPEAQRAKMETYREWFHDRRRPLRGDVAP